MVLGVVKNFSLGICDGAPSTARSSFTFTKAVLCGISPVSLLFVKITRLGFRGFLEYMV